MHARLNTYAKVRVSLPLGALYCERQQRQSQLFLPAHAHATIHTADAQYVHAQHSMCMLSMRVWTLPV
jgi:hypothetical protein